MTEALTLLKPLLPILTHPLGLLAGFVAASALMIWRLHAVENKGFEGTVLGTLIMPYCSGAANLMFAWVMAQGSGKGGTVMENALVNNVTNLMLILGLSALLFATAPAARGSKHYEATYKLFRLDLLLTLVALFLFTGSLWALGRDGSIGFNDALVLVALFVFWQVLHVFEVLKNNVRKNQTPHWSIAIDLLLIGLCAWGIFESVDRLTQWVEASNGRLFNGANLGWLSGLLMVLPNAFLALYFSRAGRQDIVVSSQVGDAHICIPMAVGLFALFEPISVPRYFETGLIALAAAGAVHFLFIAALGRLPRVVGALLLLGYAGFMTVGPGGAL